MHLRGSGYLYSPIHRWCYFRDMTREELLFIKTYDSAHNKAWQNAQHELHRSVRPGGCTSPESLDIRAVAGWD